MLSSALAAANNAKKTKDQMDEEKRQKTLFGLKKPRKQGWFKPCVKEKYVSAESVDSSDNSKTRATSRGSRGSHPPHSPVVNAECVPASPGAPPREVNVQDASKIRSSSASASGMADDVSVLSSSVAQTTLTASPHSIGENIFQSTHNQNQVVDALINGMDDDRMADVTLLGKNGAKIRATKFVLACRSPALQEKLYADPSSSEVFIGDYGEHAILAMKTYCHTGEVNGATTMGQKNADGARNLVELASLGKVYGFEPLYGEADSVLYQLLNGSPWFSTAAFDSTGEDTKLIEEFLIQFIKRRCPDLLLETNALKYVSQERLLVLLDGLGCKDAEMLKYLEKWIELKGATRENVNFLRATAAKKLSLVELLKDPEMIPHVRSSGIFDRYMVESIINASPILEEEEEDDNDDDDDDGMERVSMYDSPFPCSPDSNERPMHPEDLQSPHLSKASSSGKSGKSKKKKKKKDKDKEKDKKSKKSSKSEKSKRRSSVEEHFGLSPGAQDNMAALLEAPAEVLNNA
jgi:hypothetical protein